MKNPRHARPVNEPLTDRMLYAIMDEDSTVNRVARLTIGVAAIILGIMVAAKFLTGMWTW